MRHQAPATRRNRDSILVVLERVLPSEAIVLEIASGTGEHAVYFAERLPGLTWQPSDLDPESRHSIDAWRSGGPENVLPSIAIDVREDDWNVSPVDAVVCINMVHISPWAATIGLFRGAARLLAPGGVLYLYGPFAVGGRHTAPTNAAFDESLRARDPEWGVRDLEDVVVEAKTWGFSHRETVEMPANNLSVVFVRDE